MTLYFHTVEACFCCSFPIDLKVGFQGPRDLLPTCSIVNGKVLGTLSSYMNPTTIRKVIGGRGSRILFTVDLLHTLLKHTVVGATFLYQNALNTTGRHMNSPPTFVAVVHLPNTNLHKTLCLLGNLVIVIYLQKADLSDCQRHSEQEHWALTSF